MLSGAGVYIGSKGIIPLGLIYFGLVLNSICEIVYYFTRKSKFSRDYLSKYSYFGLTFLLGSLLGAATSALTNNEMDELKPILLSAAIVSSSIFIAISIFSLLTVRRLMIYFGAIISCFVLSIIAIFLTGLFEAVVGLVIACIYVIVDTQLMIHKAENGVYEPYEDARQLYLDFVKIFLELIKIFGKKKEE